MGFRSIAPRRTSPLLNISRNFPGHFVGISYFLLHFREISWTFPGYLPVFSGRFPGHLWEFPASGKLSRIFPGHFGEHSEKFPGHFQEIFGTFRDISCKFAGNLLDISTFPGNFQDFSVNSPGHFWEFLGQFLDILGIFHAIFWETPKHFPYHFRACCVNFRGHVRQKSGKFPGHFRAISQPIFLDISENLLGTFQDFSRIFPGISLALSGKFQGLFLGIVVDISGNVSGHFQPFS